MLYISVIIPNYNHGQFLENRINSILNQTYKYFEIIILDDSSTDNSREIINSFRGHTLISHIVYNENNSKSPFYQWVKGIKLAKYNWIWIAESDDIADPTFLEEAVNIISNNENIGLYFCNSKLEYDDGKIETTSNISKINLKINRWDNSYISKGIDEINISLKYFSAIPNSSAALFKKDLIYDYLKTINKFKFYGDWFSYIAILQNCSIAYNKKCLNKFRRSAISHSILNQNKNLITKKKEYFRILKLLFSIRGLKNKKEILYWYTYIYITIGFRTEGIFNVFKIIANFYRISFQLTTLYLITRISMKFNSNYKTHLPYFLK